MVPFPIIFRTCLFLISDFGIFRLFIRSLYKSKSKSLTARAGERKSLIAYITFLLVCGREIILPSLSMMCLKYSKSSFALFNLL